MDTIQHEISQMSIDDGIELCKALEEFTNNKWLFVLQVWTEGGFSLIRKDYWKDGEHTLGHTDQLVLSVGSV